MIPKAQRQEDGREMGGDCGQLYCLITESGRRREEGGGRKEEASADEFDMLVYIGIVDVFSISL